MRKLFRTLSLFRTFKKGVIKNQIYLNKKYGLDINFWYELSTTVFVGEAPEELKNEYGISLAEVEVRKYIQLVLSDIDKLELNELVKVYEIKRLNADNYGVTFGFSVSNNKKIIKYKLIFYTLLLLCSISLVII